MYCGLQIYGSEIGSSSEPKRPYLSIFGGHVGTDRIIDVYDGRTVFSHKRMEQTRLRIEIVFHIGMKIEMVATKVGEDGDLERDSVCPMHGDTDGADFH